MLEVFVVEQAGAATPCSFLKSRHHSEVVWFDIIILYRDQN